jgi:type IV secretory pathway VirB4 component
MDEIEKELEETLENPQEDSFSGSTHENQKTEGASTSEDEVEKLKKINSQLYARLKKLEAKTKEIKVEEKSDNGDFEKKIEFALFHARDLGKEELEEIFAYAKAKGISYEDAYKSPMIQTYLERVREQKKAEQAQVSSSGGGSLETKYSEEELKNMPLSELEKIIPKSSK